MNRVNVRVLVAAVFCLLTVACTSATSGDMQSNSPAIPAAPAPPPEEADSRAMQSIANDAQANQVRTALAAASPLRIEAFIRVDSLGETPVAVQTWERTPADEADRYAWNFTKLVEPFVTSQATARTVAVATWRYTFSIRPKWLAPIAEPIGNWLLGKDIEKRLLHFAKGCEDPELLERARQQLDGPPAV